MASPTAATIQNHVGVGTRRVSGSAGFGSETFASTFGGGAGAGATFSAAPGSWTPSSLGGSCTPPKSWLPRSCSSSPPNS